MSKISGIEPRMPVVAADGRAVGFVSKVGSDHVMITSLKDGCGFEHAIPLAWVEGVDRYVFLNHASRFVEANRKQMAGGAARAIAA
jgi:hypothetical protein